MSLSCYPFYANFYAAGAGSSMDLELVPDFVHFEKERRDVTVESDARGGQATS